MKYWRLSSSSPGLQHDNQESPAAFLGQGLFPNTGEETLPDECDGEEEEEGEYDDDEEEQKSMLDLENELQKYLVEG